MPDTVGSMTQRTLPWQNNSQPAAGDTLQGHGGARTAVDPRDIPERFKRVLPYHRLALADRNHAWWMPLIEGLVLIALYLVLSVIFLVIMALAAPDLDTSDLLDGDQMKPLTFFILFASVALLFPTAILARLVLGPRPLGLLFSVTGRIRWRWLLTSLGVAAGIFVAAMVVELVIQWTTTGEGWEVVPLPSFWLLILMIVTVVPVQCAAEELVFRGYLAQMIGRWLKNPAWAILLPVPLFVLGHMYDVWGQASVGVMAVAMGLVTWRTGGLESAIAIHMVNNMFVSLMASLGLADMNDTTGAPMDLVTTVAINGVFVALIFWLVKRNPDLQTTRTVITTPPAVLPYVTQVPQLGGFGLVGELAPAGSMAPTRHMVLTEPMGPVRTGVLAAGSIPPAATVVVLDERTGVPLVLPAHYGPYVVHDAQGRRVGQALPVRQEHQSQ